jgi:hypothetical protein
VAAGFNLDCGNHMLKENDRVVLLHDLPNFGLQPGDVGTVVKVLDGRAGYEVEFKTLAGETIAVTTLLTTQFRAVDPRDMMHVRKLAEM